MDDSVEHAAADTSGAAPPCGDPALAAAILAGALDGILTVDADGRLVGFNPAAERTLGWRREEVLGRRPEGLVLADGTRLDQGDRLGRRLEVEALRRDGTRFRPSCR